MIKSNQLITDYAVLAETSYVTFKTNDLGSTDKMKTAILSINPKTGKAGYPESFADYVTEKYNVIAHYTDRVEPSL